MGVCEWEGLSHEGPLASAEGSHNTSNKELTADVKYSI